MGVPRQTILNSFPSLIILPSGISSYTEGRVCSSPRGACPDSQRDQQGRDSFDLIPLSGSSPFSIHPFLFLTNENDSNVPPLSSSISSPYGSHNGICPSALFCNLLIFSPSFFVYLHLVVQRISNLFFSCPIF